MRTIAKGIACLTAALFVSASAQAAISVSSLGQGAPPATLDGIAMTAAPLDPAPVFADVLSAPLAAGHGSVGFSVASSHRRIGSGWVSWSHGYTGDVYYTNGATSLTMSVSGLAAFYFYVESNPFQPFEATVTATDSGGATSTTTGTGHGSAGATGFGVVASGATVSTITVSVINTGTPFGPTDFAVGEFGSAIPGPASLALLGAAGLVGRRRRRS